WLQHRVYRRLRDAELVASPRAWRFFRFLDRLTLVRQRLFGTANPNPQLLWEEVLMDWRSVLDFDRRHSTQIDGRQEGMDISGGGLRHGILTLSIPDEIGRAAGREAVASS